MNEPKKCARCNHADVEISMECRRCHCVALVMIQVHKRYEQSALNNLVDVLRGKRISDLMSGCPANAYSSMSVFSHIIALAHPARMDADSLKKAVADQILRDLGSFEGIRKYEELNGKGSYMRAWIGKLSTILKDGVISA